MLKSKLNLNHISKILYLIFKKFHRFKFSSKNLYILILLVISLDLNKVTFIQHKNRVTRKNIKYYYILYFIFINKILRNYSYFRKIENNINSDSFKLSLDYKDNYFLIYLENFSSETNSFKNINYNFFLKSKKSLIYFEEYYKFRLDIYSFLFYGKYMEYIRKSIYNEYLTFTRNLWNYPLLKTFFRLITYTRLSKLKDSNFNFATNQAILSKYHIYDDFDIIKVEKSRYIVSNFNGSDLLISNLMNTHLFKLLTIWKNKKFYFYLDSVFSRFFKSNLIIPAYHINLNYEEYDDITDTNKLNMMGLYSLYWQMNRYGFRFNYYYYLHSLGSCLLNNNFNSIANYNLFYLKFILCDNLNNYWIFWYRLMKLVLLDFIYKSFFKFFKFNKLNLKRKKLRFKRLLSFKLLMQTYSFIFLPLDLEIYNNPRSLSRIIKIKKDNLSNILINIFFGYDFNLVDDLDLDLLNISKKLDLDNFLFNNFDYYLNLCIFFLTRKIGKYYFINFFTQYNGLKYLAVKFISSYTNSDKLSSSQVTRDSLLLKSQKYMDFSLSKHIGKNYFFSYRSRFLSEYLWDFEFPMIYSFYLIILYKYNQLYLKIFIGKFLLFGSK